MLKNESARNRRNLFHCVHLVFLILVVYLLCQTESVWRRYRILSEKSNRQKIADCAVRTDVDVACPYADVESLYSDMWQVHTGDMWQPRVMTRVRQIWTFGHTAGPIPR
jgi:hypothetical protein